MKRVDFYGFTIIGFIFLFSLSIGLPNLYESYLGGRFIYGVTNSNNSVNIGNDSCFTSIYDDTINFTCGGTINGNVTLENFNNYYAELYYTNYTNTVINFASAETYYPLFFTEDMNNGFTSNNLGLLQSTNVTCDKSGVYLVNYMSVGTGVNNHEYHLVVFINDVEIEKCETFQKLSATGDFVTMNGNCIVNLNVGDDVSLRIADYTSSSVGNYNIGNLALVRVGNV